MEIENTGYWKQFLILSFKHTLLTWATENNFLFYHCKRTPLAWVTENNFLAEFAKCVTPVRHDQQKRTDTRLVFYNRKLMRTDIFFTRTTKPICNFVNPVSGYWKTISYFIIQMYSSNLGDWKQFLIRLLKNKFLFYHSNVPLFYHVMQVKSTHVTSNIIFKFTARSRLVLICWHMILFSRVYAGLELWALNTTLVSTIFPLYHDSQFYRRD